MDLSSSHLNSLRSVHSYLDKQGSASNTSFLLINKHLSWRPSGALLQSIVQYFPSNTPLAFATSSPLLRIHTERLALNGFGVDGFYIAPKTRLSLSLSQDACGCVVEEDLPRETQQFMFLTPAEQRNDISAHRYPLAGFQPRNHADCEDASFSFCSRHCHNPNPADLSLCVSVVCTSPATLRMALRSSWWLSRYYGVSLSLEGMKAEQLQDFKQLQRCVVIRELKLTRCVFSEDWLQCISACTEMTALSIDMCCAHNNISIQLINPILNNSRPASAAVGAPGAGMRVSSAAVSSGADRSEARSNWYLSGKRSIGQLRKLRCLHVNKTPVAPEFLKSLSTCASLECVILCRVRGLKSLAGLVTLPSLKSVALQTLWLQDEGFAGLSSCRNLRYLCIEECHSMPNIDFVSADLAATLQRLTLSSNWLTDPQLARLSRCRGLEEVQLGSLKRLTTVSCLRGLEKLTVLDASHNSLDTFGCATIGQLPQLARLNLIECRGITTVESWLPQLKYTLTSLDLTQAQITDGSLACIVNCPNLLYLNLSECSHITALPRDTRSPSMLRWLNLSDTGVTDEGLARLCIFPWLRYLCLNECTAFTSLAFLRGMANLEFLYLENTSFSDDSLPCVSECSRLVLLDLARCRFVKNVNVLRCLTRLKELDLSYSAVTNRGLEFVHQFRALEVMSVRHCSRLSTLSMFTAMPSLKVLLADSLPIDDPTTAFRSSLAKRPVKPASASGRAEKYSRRFNDRSSSSPNVGGGGDGGHHQGDSSSSLANESEGAAAAGTTAAIGFFGSSGSGGTVRYAARRRFMSMGGGVRATVVQSDPDDFDGGRDGASEERGRVGVAKSDGAHSSYNGSPRSQSHGKSKSLNSSVNIPRPPMSPPPPPDARDDESPKAASAAELPLASATATASANPADLTSLLELSLRKCTFHDLSLSDLLHTCTYLTKLDITECLSLSSLDALRRLDYLRTLRASSAALTNESVVSVAHCRSLEDLVLSDSALVTDVNPLGVLRKLKHGTFARLGVTNDGIQGLAACIGLKELHLTECRFLSNVNCLATLSLLKELHLESTDVTTRGVRGLARCTSLEKLYFNKCRKLTSVEHLRSTLQQLEILDVYGTAVTPLVASRRYQSSGECAMC